MADKCTPVVSSWLTHVGTFGGHLFCVFRNGVCCLYPNTDDSYYDLAIAYASKGHFVHEWLFKLLPYRLIKNPCPSILGVAVGCCPVVLPRVLHATMQVTPAANCTCFTGSVSAELTWNPSGGLFGWWAGQAPFSGCGGNATLHFFCANGVTVDDFRLEWFVPPVGCSFVDLHPNAGGSGDLLHVVFDVLVSGASACYCAGDTTWRCTVTR